MKIINDESYESAAAEWQYQMISMLKDTLAKYGVDKAKLKDICGEFSFDLAMLQDQGEIKVDGEELRPVICFENPDGELKYNSDDDFQLHDYAYGNTSEVFGD
ncbi:hypothetical protein [uncultured Allomuricauda sp.]|uniref:hypothetical protein n=1 Tax=Flagellimonas sp. W118 TaxID=3410791 RepID=UPI002607B766|nr:hypothetical protein [uncultured Allomuricauda sp.]